MDANFLERDYGVEVANTVDLRTHARECWVQTPSRSLAGMVSSLLGKELPKDPTIRLSRWSAALTDSQVIMLFLLYKNFFLLLPQSIPDHVLFMLGLFGNDGKFSTINGRRCTTPAWMLSRPFSCTVR